MGKFDGVLLVSDFDDTLYDSHCQVPRRNLEALDRFLAQGGVLPWPPAAPTGPSLPMSIWPPSMPRWSSPTGRPSMTSKKDEFLVQTYLSPSAPQDLDG